MLNNTMNGNGTLPENLCKSLETVNIISYEQEVYIMSMVNSMAMFEKTNSYYSSYYLAKSRVEKILEEEYGIKVKITISCIHDSISINVEGR